MLSTFSNWMDIVNGIVWGPAMIVLLIGTGLFLTLRLRFIQLRHLKHSLDCISGKYDDPEDQGDISHFQALCAALSATIGTGNITGVALAIAVGGPGAIFWMWVTALVGMATKFSSCALALRYRVVHADGSASGGPMYYLERGLKLRWLGVIFALFAGIASLGIGSAVQSNSVVDGLLSVAPESWQEATLASNIPLLSGAPIAKPILGLVLAVLVGIVTIGGIKRIATVASRVVPFMCVVYVGSALLILIMNAGMIPEAFAQIFRYAFSPMAVGGGFFGTVMARTVQKGVARGVFSNESGLGSAPIAHGAARTSEMAREGFVAMLGPFIDTIIICTLTALVIITSGAWQVESDAGELLYGPGGKGLPMKIEVDGQELQVVGTVSDEPEPFLNAAGQPYEVPSGAPLTARAFEAALPRVGDLIVAFALVFFAYSTMIAWSYYGDRSAHFLFGEGAVRPYRVLYTFLVMIGAAVPLKLVWNIADITNLLMALPNLLSLALLAGLVQRLKNEYFSRSFRIATSEAD